MDPDVPYMPSVKNLHKMLDAVQRAGVPEVFNQDFLVDLGFKSSYDRKLIQVLKYLGMLDSSNRPQDSYRRFVDHTQSRLVLAASLRSAFDDLYLADQNAHEKSTSELKGWVKTKTGAGDAVAKKIATTFKSLADYADFSSREVPKDTQDVREESPERIAPPTTSERLSARADQQRIDQTKPETKMSKQKEPESQDPESNEVAQHNEDPSIEELSQTIESDQQSILEAARRLESAAGSFHRQEQEYRNIQTTQVDVQRAMATLIRSAEAIAAAAGNETRNREAAPFRQVYEYQDCECCECVDHNCCCFEFIFKRVRVVAGQVGVDQTLDGETTTGAAGARSGLECQFFASIDGAGIIVPNQIWGFLQLTKRANRPGIWHDINRVVNRIYVRRGTRRTRQFSVQVVEREVGTVETVLGKNEFGNARGEIVLNCNCDQAGPVYVAVALDGGGRGGGEVECVFEAVRKG